MEQHFAVFQSVVQAAGDCRLAVNAAAFAGIGIESHPILAGILSAVESKLGVTQKQVRSKVVVRINGNSYGKFNIDVVVDYLQRLVKAGVELFKDFVYRRGIRTELLDNDKFIAAETENGILQAFEFLAESGKNRVSVGVTEGLVDPFEVINVHEHHRKTASAVSACAYHVVYIFVKAYAVVESCEGVGGVKAAYDRILCLYDLGDPVEVGCRGAYFVLVGYFNTVVKVSGGDLLRTAAKLVETRAFVFKDIDSENERQSRKTGKSNKLLTERSVYVAVDLIAVKKHNNVPAADPACFPVAVDRFAAGNVAVNNSRRHKLLGYNVFKRLIRQGKFFGKTGRRRAVQH